MNDGYEIQIDELRLCYHAEMERLKALETVEIGDSIDFRGYILTRIASDRFRYYFAIWNNFEHVAYIKYKHYNDGDNAQFNVFFESDEPYFIQK